VRELLTKAEDKAWLGAADDPGAVVTSDAVDGTDTEEVVAVNEAVSLVAGTESVVGRELLGDPVGGAPPALTRAGELASTGGFAPGPTMPARLRIMRLSSLWSRRASWDSAATRAADARTSVR
jgi:hypothetical protein